MTNPPRFPRRALVAALLAGGGLAGATLLPAPAQAYWRGGVWIGVTPAVPYYPPPVYAPPPVYVAPPPVYTPPPVYAPPPVYSAPPAYAGPAYGSTCYAGFYTCRLPQQQRVGSGCSCPGLGAPSYGTVH